MKMGAVLNCDEKVAASPASGHEALGVTVDAECFLSDAIFILRKGVNLDSRPSDFSYCDFFQTWV